MKLESRWFAVGGLNLHALVAANASARNLPPVVLVHGLGVSSRYMIPAMIQLSQDADIYAPDLPGFGKSDKPPHMLNVPELSETLADWLRGVGIRQVTLVGHSFGCQVVVEFAVRHPERVGRAVLAAPTGSLCGRTAFRYVWRLLRDVPREPLSLVPL